MKGRAAARRCGRRARCCRHGRRPRDSKRSVACCVASEDYQLSSLTDGDLQEQLDFVLGQPPTPPKEYDGPPIEALAAQLDQDPYINIFEGPNGYPLVALTHPNGSEAVVHLHGGTVSSWMDKNALEMIFVHPNNDFDPYLPIGGGLQPIFPQYATGLPGMADRRTLPTDGFLATTHFTLLATHIDEEGEDVCPGITLRTASDEDTRQLFPHDWELIYQINLMDANDPRPDHLSGEYMVDANDEVEDEEDVRASNKRSVQYERKMQQLKDNGDLDIDLASFCPVQLNICMSVSNTGDSTFQFQAAAVADIAVKDLKDNAEFVKFVGAGHHYALDLSTAAQPKLVHDDENFLYPELKAGRRQNLVYAAMSDSDIMFCPGNREHFKVMWGEGFHDFVCAHPDVAECEYSYGFVRTGVGKIVRPVVLKPGEVWHGDFSLRKHYKYWPQLPFEDSSQTPLLESDF